ncbi:Myelin-oligodendrocyte glycoprotein [Oryzias melastigma]|uniref:Myelin-oligodendrocyte glycoprotein n=1 Tax=Oryzias melastigma TaxID=30732 RepID=A0A834FPW3_ORYME|nr:Myelin-oligodendrocyte glycoprotein [Oryzias melastigma]
MFALLCLAALRVSLLSQQASAGITDIRAVPGQNVTLPCRAPKSNPIIAIEWFKPGEEETYLLLYRAGLVLPDGQHPAYRNRVAFQKEQTKDGDASVTLRAVTVEDSGTYTCVVSQRETSQTRSRQILPTTFIRLTVDPAPSSPASRGGGSLGLTALQLVLAVMISSV